MYNCADNSNINYGNFTFPDQPAKLKPHKIIQKPFDTSKNAANRNMCLLTAHLSQNLCENLCFDSGFSYSDDRFKYSPESETWENARKPYNHLENSECMNICMVAADMEVKEDCPFESRCPDGCPCPGYKCNEDMPDYSLAVIEKHDRGEDPMRFLYRIFVNQSLSFQGRL